MFFALWFTATTRSKNVKYEALYTSGTQADIYLQQPIKKHCLLYNIYVYDLFEMLGHPTLPFYILQICLSISVVECNTFCRWQCLYQCIGQVPLYTECSRNIYKWTQTATIVDCVKCEKLSLIVLLYLDVLFVVRLVCVLVGIKLLPNTWH